MSYLNRVANRRRVAPRRKQVNVRRNRYNTKIVRKGNPMNMGGSNRSYFYKYKVAKGTVGIGAGVAFNYNGISFTLSDIPNSAELTSLYDEYCISKLVVEFIPRAGALSNSNTGANGNVDVQYTSTQPFITVIDYDDATVPSTRVELLQYQTAKYTKPTSMVKRIFTPKVAIQTYKTSISSGYMAKGHQWLDCADDTVPHYGIKWAWDQSVNAPAGGVTVMDIYVTYYVKFRGVR